MRAGPRRGQAPSATDSSPPSRSGQSARAAWPPARASRDRCRADARRLRHGPRSFGGGRLAEVGAGRHSTAAAEDSQRRIGKSPPPGHRRDHAGQHQLRGEGGEGRPEQGIPEPSGKHGSFLPVRPAARPASARGRRSTWDPIGRLPGAYHRLLARAGPQPPAEIRTMPSRASATPSWPSRGSRSPSTTRASSIVTIG